MRRGKTRETNDVDPFAFITLVTLVAGAGGTGLGGLVGALFKSESNRTVSLLLAFAGGVMLAIVCFDLLAEAVEAAEQISAHAVLVVMGAVVAGVGVVYGLNYAIDRCRTWPTPAIPRRTTTWTSSSTPTTWRNTGATGTRGLPS